ncbi:uncharacterized protein FOMMEDRAFT_20269 [Fomitiporia mediterranea MF3/22]|uniref:uncharacterized protein n=1 Tax=Fomitiporia mediterranea (strain MF3/22) TaxID=694068 RepID=UPI0004408AD5|nr:uncharacterized protein FOMMEDRAFT_20269 [Fomitiporia mediterranea MF3/22]EJD03105.1 hypothetical protein FOMMEDRAFT_20269 [Fomitiporia mediterranea MF3/22]
MYVLLYVLLGAGSCAFSIRVCVALGRPTDLCIPPLTSSAGQAQSFFPSEVIAK